MVSWHHEGGKMSIVRSGKTAVSKHCFKTAAGCLYFALRPGKDHIREKCFENGGKTTFSPMLQYNKNYYNTLIRYLQEGILRL